MILQKWLRLFFLVNLKIYSVVSVPWYFIVTILGVRSFCKYPVSCSRFARAELMTNPSLLVAVQKIGLRLLSCGPWNGVWRRS